jgi:CspA family cold shock protein
MGERAAACIAARRSRYTRQPMRSAVDRTLTFGLDPRRQPANRHPPNLSCLRAQRGGPEQSAPFTHIEKASYDMRTTGTVKFFNSAKGFGFITPDEGGKDVFVHATAVEAAGMRALNEGDRVSFELEDDRKGRGKQAGQLKKA